MSATPAIPDVIAARRDAEQARCASRGESDRVRYAATTLAARCSFDVLKRLSAENGNGDVTLRQLVDLIVPLLPLVVTEQSLRGEE